MESVLRTAEKHNDIAFVTVNYNTRELVREMLDFFRSALLPFSYKLVVVDNNSTDGSHEFLAAQDDLLYVPAGENLGYGRAINRGIQASDSRYICVLNTDVVLNEACLTRLWEFMEQTPESGVVSPRIANRDGSTQGFIFHKCRASIILNIVNKLITSALKRKLAQASAPVRVHGVLGAFFVIRRTAFSGDRLFDEDFFFYYEDTDLAHRLFDAGIPCYALPDCSVIHLGGSSTSIEGARMFYKSKRLYLTKHYGSSFAGTILSLDRLRLRMKHLKYILLSLVIPSEKIARKKGYYAAMQQSILPGGNAGK